MFHQSQLERIRKRWKVITLLAVIGAVVLVVGTILSPIPLEYKADSQVLIISESRYGVDAYTAAKSAERIGENLAQVVQTSDFYNKVFALGIPNLDQRAYQNIPESRRRKLWQKNVEASVVFGTSVMTFSAYHEDPEQARIMSGALAQTMLTHARDYVGGDIQMRVVNQPVVSEYPVRPSFMILAAIGALLGVLLAVFLFIKK
jgi:capsular polysaccharide biosynthesis protein